MYAEARSTGPGADAAARVWWSHQLTDAQAANWNATAVLRGWDPLAGLREGEEGRRMLDAMLAVGGGGRENE